MCRMIIHWCVQKWNVFLLPWPFPFLCFPPHHHHHQPLLSHIPKHELHLGETCLMINTLKTQLDFNVVHSKTCIQVSYYLCLLSFGPFSRLQCIYPSLQVYYYLITLGFTSFLSGNLSQRIHTYIETYINNLAISSSHSALFAFLTSHRD